MDRPLLSFILLSFNQEGFLGDAIDGALAQTYSPLEIVIQDDCSSDRSFDVIQEKVARYSGPHSIQCLRTPRNLGLAGNLTRAMEMCRGELIVKADGDDVSVPMRTETIYQAWRQSGRKATGLFSCYTLLSGDGSDQGLSGTCGEPGDTRLTWRLEGELFSFLSTRVPMIHGCSAVYSPALLDRFGAVRGDMEDLVLCFRTLAIGQLFYVNRPLVKYRRHGENMTFRGKEAVSSFESRERRLRRGNEITIGGYTNILDDIEVLNKTGLLAPAECARLKSEAQRVLRPFEMELAMMNGSLWERTRILTTVLQSGNLRDFCKAIPRGLPRRLYRMLYIARERWRSQLQRSAV